MSVNGTLVEATVKCAHSPLNLRIFSSISVTFTLTTVQVPNLVLTHMKRITVQCLPPRPNWDPHPPLPKQVGPPGTEGAGHTRLRVRGWGGGAGFQLGRLEEKPSTLSTLCMEAF